MIILYFLALVLPIVLLSTRLYRIKVEGVFPESTVKNKVLRKLLNGSEIYLPIYSGFLLGVAFCIKDASVIFQLLCIEILFVFVLLEVFLPSKEVVMVTTLKKRIKEEIEIAQKIVPGSLFVIYRDFDAFSKIYETEFGQYTKEYKMNCANAEKKSLCYKGSLLEPQCFYFNIDHCDDLDFVDEIVKTCKLHNYKNPIFTNLFYDTV